MLNLTHFQALFNEDNTSIRCRRVLDEVAPVIKPIFQSFVESIGIPLGNDYLIRNYDVTLSTTYSDAKNPTYAEKKKNSDIGRKYFIALNRKVGEKEYNLLTLELDGINTSFGIHTEINFIPFWAWVKNEQIHNVLGSIPEEFSIYTGWQEKKKLNKDEFVEFVRGCIKPRKRPWFQIGKSLTLEGQIDENTIINELIEAWEKLGPFRAYFNKEIDTSKRAYDALMTLAATRNITETQLLGRKYTIEIASVETHKTNEKRQSFHLYDGDQLITKGYLRYLDYHDRNSPFQTIIVQIEGKYHIYTNAREILGASTKKWWLTKSFATHNLDNQEILSTAMRLLGEHQFQVNGNEYYIGSYNNESMLFVEGAEKVKKNFIDAAILFAHASKRLELPTEDMEETLPNGGPESDNIEEDLEPSFQFEQIYNTISNSQFTFSKEIIRDLHLNLTALDDKHFVLLSGISGTGKTQLCRLYTNAVYGLDYESDNPYFTIIPVRPDWTDSSALFGYYSSFEKRYVKTEFLNVILSALKEREKPHFILLDEMNLARVEYYLSDYLSAVESRKEIPLHQDENISEIPKKLSIPPNVYILGTINVDETTHSISDKVLDRAFVMTLSDVDFDTYWERANQDLKASLTKEFQMLRELHRILANFELHFGYRTMGEMLHKLYSNQQLPEEHQMDSMDALDRVISEKVLTKVRGDERIAEMLAKMELWLKENLDTSSCSLQHVKRMQEELEHYGATQFWR